jgi:aspartate carbamoyltransferase catalytic subunit
MANCAEIVPQHAISMHDFSREAMEGLFGLAENFRNASPEDLLKLGRGKVVGLLFYQPSTRTRLNFQAAAQRIGASVIGFSDVATTRAGDFYHESLEDVVGFTSVLCDLLVLRHNETGASDHSVKHTQVPLINAGDGYNQHPTQALGDIYTMHRLLGDLSGKRIGMIGDLRVRSLRSILIGLRHFRIATYLFLLPADVDIPEDAKQLLASHRQEWEVVSDVDSMLEAADLVETIGINHPNHELPRDATQSWTKTLDRFRITREKILRCGRAIPILHPGPRTDEIDPDVDALPNAYYFEQARNGMWMRMALISALLKRRAYEVGA